jgi:hypothetical protein
MNDDDLFNPAESDDTKRRDEANPPIGFPGSWTGGSAGCCATPFAPVPLSANCNAGTTALGQAA